MSDTPNPLLVTEKEIEKIIQDLLVAKYPNNPPNFEGNERAKTKLIDLMIGFAQKELEMAHRAGGIAKFDNATDVHIDDRIDQLNTYRDGGGK